MSAAYTEVFVDNGVEYTVANNTIVDMNISKDCSGIVKIPSKTANERKISSIGSGLYSVVSKCELAAVEIAVPSTVRKLAPMAFSQSRQIKKVKMTNSVTKIGTSAFCACGVESIEWPDSCKEVPKGCFIGSDIKKFIAGSSLSAIAANAFDGSDVEEIDLSKSLLNVSFSNFKRCDHLKKIIPSYYTYLGSDPDSSLYDIAKDGSMIKKETKAAFAGAISIRGKEFVITGTLSRVRADFEDEITSRGGFVKNKVGARTDYLIVGDKPGATKVRDAKRYGTPVISEGDLLAAM